MGAPLLLDPSDGQSTVGWVPPYPVAPAPARPLWRRIPIRLWFFVIVIAAGGIGGFITNASRSPSGDIFKGGDMSATDLRVGDCFDFKDPTADTIDNVTARPCTEAHEYELFYVATMPGDTYPTDDAVMTFVQTACEPVFDTYVGKAFSDSGLDIAWLYPASDGWAAGDRSVQCSAYNPNNNQLTASVKGSGQ